MNTSRNSRGFGLALLAVIVLIALLLWQKQPQLTASLPSFASSNTASATPCYSQTEAGFTVALLGYTTNVDESTTLYWQVANTHTQELGYVAFGTNDWLRIAPESGSLYTGTLGVYPVTWTNSNGNPGFVSVKYESTTNGFVNGAVDAFALTVRNFSTHTPIAVEAKAGQWRGAITFTLDSTTCEMPPVSTTTPSATTPTPVTTSEDTACLRQTEQGFTFSLLGYERRDDGSYQLTWRVTNTINKDISYVAFGTHDWTRLQPAHDSTYTGVLGDYSVEWTNDNGNPGFPSVKYGTGFSGYNDGASDTFTIVVDGFNPAAPIQLEAKAGLIRAAVTVTPSAGMCEIMPTPTPPFSPLPTPTATPEGGVNLPTTPQVAQCIFTPSADGVSTEAMIPLAAYSFSQPQLMVTNKAPGYIEQWLPDSKRLLVKLQTERGNKLVLVDTKTKAVTQLLEPDRAIDFPQWLSVDETVAWRELDTADNGGGYWVRSFAPPGERRLSSSANGSGTPHDNSPDGKEFIFMSLPGGTRPMIWNQETKTLRSLPFDLMEWRYSDAFPYPFMPFNVNWHPGGRKLLFWDGTWVFLYDLTTNQGCEINLRMLSPSLSYARSASWSPNGRYLLMKVSDAPLYQSLHGPFDRLLVLDTYTGDTLKHALGNPLHNFSWAVDNQTVAVVGGNEQLVKFPDGDVSNSVSLYLFNIYSGEYQQILTNFFAGSEQGIAWSPDGKHLAFLGSPLANNELTGTGGVYVSQVTINP